MFSLTARGQVHMYLACSRLGRADRAYHESNFERAALPTRLESHIERAIDEHARTYPRR
jgi:hypothetical protein